LKPEDINMLHADIEEIFYEFESDEPRQQKIQNIYKDRFLAKFENIDNEIEDMLIEATKLFENDKIVEDSG
jgi:hypothetical protein